MEKIPLVSKRERIDDYKECIGDLFSQNRQQYIAFAESLLLKEAVVKSDKKALAEDLVQVAFLSIIERHNIDFSKSKQKIDSDVYDCIKKEVVSYLKLNYYKPGSKIPEEDYVPLEEAKGVPDDAPNKEEISKNLNEHLSTLNPQQERILRMHSGMPPYERGYTLKEIGEKEGVTVKRVMQIEDRALNRMRHSTRTGEMNIFSRKEKDINLKQTELEGVTSPVVPSDRVTPPVDEKPKEPLPEIPVVDRTSIQSEHQIAKEKLGFFGRNKRKIVMMGLLIAGSLGLGLEGVKRKVLEIEEVRQVELSKRGIIRKLRMPKGLVYNLAGIRIESNEKEIVRTLPDGTKEEYTTDDILYSRKLPDRRLEVYSYWKNGDGYISNIIYPDGHSESYDMGGRVRGRSWEVFSDKNWEEYDENGKIESFRYETPSGVESYRDGILAKYTNDGTWISQHSLTEEPKSKFR